MSLFTTSQFASAAAQGTDWRDTAKTVLEKLESVRTKDDGFNFGFLYVSDVLADDATSILNLFKSVLEIENWVGGIGIGLCANGESFVDVPAISTMIGCFEPGDVQLFPPANTDTPENANTLQPWLEDHDPMLVLVHGDPMAEEDPAQSLQNFERECNGFIVGGMTSSRNTHTQFAGDVFEGGLCGAAFSSTIPVASTLSQGCKIIGAGHTVTRCDGHALLELDSRKAAEVFEDDLRSMVVKKIDRDPDTIMVDEAALKDHSAVPEEFHSLFEGEVHAAFPVSESDQNDFLVRNIMNIDPEEGSLMISEHLSNGQRIMFVHRDHDSVYEDLSTRLLDLRKRVEKDTGRFEPKGALYISCVARAFNEFEGDHQNEMALIRDIIGDVPLTGFYAGGEINKARLYGYTGILTLFL